MDEIQGARESKTPVVGCQAVSFYGLSFPVYIIKTLLITEITK